MGIRAKLIPACLAGLLVAPGGGLASTPYCVDLEGRLAAVEANAASPWNDDTRQIEAAITKQRIELDNAVTEARRAGCTGFASLFNGRTAGPGCSRLTAGINRMRANLDRLNAQRRQAARDPYAADRERVEILRALAANRCGPQYEVYADMPARRPGFFATLFGTRPFRGVWDDDYGPRNGFGAGTYRTLCVRTCDGYYFPISYQTASSGFAADEGACRALCPGTDVALYVHRNPGEDTDAMVSLAGIPYGSLPTAFRYRREYDAACTCGPVTAYAASPGSVPYGDGPASLPGLAPLAPADPSQSVPASEVVVPLPALRGTGIEDPETIANRAGGLAPRAVVRETYVPPVVAVGPDGKAVRVVGPSYLVTR